jgi:hypothetical protein
MVVVSAAVPVPLKTKTLSCSFSVAG